MKSAKRQILLFVIVYAIVSALLTVFGYTGVIYLTISVALSMYWLYRGISLYNKLEDDKWARKMFGASLLILLAILFLISIGGFLP